MSYSLSGTTPSPIPSANSAATRAFTVGAPEFLTAGVPWLDASLEARGIAPGQAPTAPSIARQALVSADGEVSDARWTEGGRLYVRWRPRSPQPAVAYATTVARILASSASRAFGGGATLLLPRYRVNMPLLREDVYVYPETTSSSGAAPVTIGASTPEKTGAAESPPARNYEAMIIAGTVGGAVAVLGTAALVIYKVRRAVRPNRRRRS